MADATRVVDALPPNTALVNAGSHSIFTVEVAIAMRSPFAAVIALPLTLVMVNWEIGVDAWLTANT